MIQQIGDLEPGPGVAVGVLDLLADPWLVGIGRGGDGFEIVHGAQAEGAGGHCEGLGATLFEGYAFDWLDDVLGAPRGR